MDSLRILVDWEFVLGESPLWDDRRGALLWSDIEAGELWRWTPEPGGGGRDDPGAGKAERFYEGPKVGGFTLEEDGRLLLFRERDVVLMDDDGRLESVTPFEDPGCVRFNDVFAAPDGSVWAGGVGKSDTSGGLFHLSRAGTLVNLFRDAKFPNGMAIPHDRRTLFYTNSTGGTIDRFDLDPETGAITNRTVIHQSGADQGVPDGLTIDTDENLWSARWGGHKVLTLSRTGDVLGEVPVPTKHVTSVAFGGPDRRTLFVTTARGPVYACEPGPSGIAEFRSRVGG